ncbi:MAG TPA: TolC family protein, partial [Sediminibacterium sp.]|nr:TolC family protein [Sediminibacterium sp.]
ASYQSDVTGINISFPGISIQPPNKDQYRITADISQLLYDGGLTKQQKILQEKNAAVQDQQLEVELYHLRERITQLYLSILYIDAQLQQAALVKADIDNGIHTVSAQVSNGMAFKSNLSLLQAERIQADQHTVELDATRKGLLDVLSIFLQTQLPYSIQLQLPEPPVPADPATITRPELALYDKQSALIAGQDQLIKARNLPKASLFAQAGYGRPGLNMLKNSFEPYGIGGLRLSWSLAGLYTAKKDRELVDINKRTVALQKETFLLNTSGDIRQQLAEISKLNKLISSDEEIIRLRNEVKKAAAAQLENGVITTNDYLKQVNAEDQSRQSLITHQIQLLQARENLELINGKAL